MGAAGKYLRKWSAPASKEAGYCFWCPGCQQPHSFRTEATEEHPKWEFNGDLDKPTFSPSLLCFTTARKNGEEIQPPIRETLCHLFVRDGMIEYCGDSPHALAGKTVPMEPFPSYWATGDPDDQSGDGS